METVVIAANEVCRSWDETKRIGFNLYTYLHHIESRERPVGDFEQTSTDISDFLKIFHGPLIYWKISNRNPTSV